MPVDRKMVELSKFFYLLQFKLCTFDCVLAKSRKTCFLFVACAVQKLIGSFTYRPVIVSSDRVLILIMPIMAVVTILPFSANVYSNDDYVSVKIIAHSSFIDLEGKLNVVGTVRNTGNLPIQTTVGLNVHDQNGIRIEYQSTYGRTIWPLNDAPFKFVIDSGTAGVPFVADVSQVEATHLTDMIILNYTSMAIGDERAFVGTVRNNAPFDIHNVSVFASVRSENATQLDSVRSNVIPVLQANEERAFVVFPNAAIKSDVYYYSCAGLDVDAPITTVDTGDGNFIPYDLNAAAQVSGIRYENETDSIAFAVRPYAPGGGPVSFMIPQQSQDQSVRVILDGVPHESAVVTADGKTIYIDFFVPQGQHDVQIQRMTSNPEIKVAQTGVEIK
jgi:hypothetical protein